MRLIIILFIFFFSISGATAQELSIYGKVTDDSNQPLAGATIKYQNKKGTITDLNGGFHIETEAETTIRLTFRYIGYKTVDTLILIEDETEVYLRIQMTKELFELPSAEITADYQNIFENYRFHIIDFTISEDIFYLIIKKGQKSFLCKANMRGTILDEHELKGGYKRFYNSCLGGIILVGNEVCAELHNLDDKLLITNEFSIDYFDKYIIPCKLKKGEALVFKAISKHNKKIDYWSFEQNKGPINLYSVYDREGEKVSQSYFSELVRGYYRESENVSLESIDYGFERENIIADGSWNGDIQDLITTNITHQLALQYQALGLKEVKSDLFVIEGQTYILDVFNKLIVHLDDNWEMNFDVLKYDLNDDIKVISDNLNQTLFQVGDLLHEVRIQNGELSLKKIGKLEHSYFNERNLLHKGTLYRLGRKSMNTVKKTIFRDSID